MAGTIPNVLIVGMQEDQRRLLQVIAKSDRITADNSAKRAWSALRKGEAPSEGTADRTYRLCLRDTAGATRPFDLETGSDNARTAKALLVAVAEPRSLPDLPRHSRNASLVLVGDTSNLPEALQKRNPLVVRIENIVDGIEAGLLGQPVGSAQGWAQRPTGDPLLEPASKLSSPSRDRWDWRTAAVTGLAVAVLAFLLFGDRRTPTYGTQAEVENFVISPMQVPQAAPVSFHVTVLLSGLGEDERVTITEWLELEGAALVRLDAYLTGPPVTGNGSARRSGQVHIPASIAPGRYEARYLMALEQLGRVSTEHRSSAQPLIVTISEPPR